MIGMRIVFDLTFSNLLHKTRSMTVNVGEMADIDATLRYIQQWVQGGNWSARGGERYNVLNAVPEAITVVAGGFDNPSLEIP